MVTVEHEEARGSKNNDNDDPGHKMAKEKVRNKNKRPKELTHTHDDRANDGSRVPNRTLQCRTSILSKRSITRESESLGLVRKVLRITEMRVTKVTIGRRGFTRARSEKRVK
ncbi:hypothetical protein V6N13_123878 [Hibiscus sabdariffa]|uniref:Uncharacterized protein n=2 Tax=Hibiscus sabdariffa TaxID=183260 RepID=A0ABR2QUQ6_9ROSI